jgi:acetyl esterase/lipase
MKKILLPLISCFVLLGTVFGQERYVDEVFTDFTVDSNVVYAQNLTVLAAQANPPQPYLPTGQFGIPALAFDLYQPVGDTVAERPLIIVLHTGTFAPIIYNGNPTGMRDDFATSQMCQSYAKRGYAVANLEYRLGWNPAAPTQAEKAASLMKAVYRAIQDTKSAVRYFRADYESGNTYGIDTSRIILSGQGSGGWVALGYASLDKLAEIQLPKFLDLSDPSNPIALIDTAVIGDWDGYGGVYNVENNVGYSNDVHMVCSMGGGIGDLSWLEAGDVPMCAVHCPTDPVAIYTTGDVAVAQIGVVTTDISGSYDVMVKANGLGNNSVLDPVNAGSDTYTLAAQAASANAQGMTDFGGTVVGAPVDNVFPFITQNPYEASPWDLWDSTTTVYIATVILGLPAQAGIDAHVSALAQNPDMSPMKSLSYIDSTLGYFCRRIVRGTNLDGLSGIEEMDASDLGIQIYPNPASQNITIHADKGTISSIRMYSTTGELVLAESGLSSNLVYLDNLKLKEGLYLCSIEIDGQTITKRVILR